MDEEILAIFGAVVLPVVGASVLGFLFIKGRHEEKMAMIEHGMILEEKKKSMSRFRALCNGLLLIGLSLGLLAGLFIEPQVCLAYSEWVIPAFIMLGGGLAFLLYYYIVCRIQAKEDGTSLDD